MQYRLDRKKLVVNKKREQEKYLVILKNQTVIIGGEFEAMKMARSFDSPIDDMYRTDKRVNSHVHSFTSLTKLIESLNPPKI